MHQITKQFTSNLIQSWSHIIDRHIGGHAYDPLVLGLLLVIGLAGMYARARAQGRRA